MRSRIAALLAVLVGVLAILGSVSAVANGAERTQRAEDSINVTGTLEDTKTDPPTPLSGVKITVLDETGKEIATGESGDDGKFSIPLPGESIDWLGKQVTVQLDAATLPEGSSLTDPLPPGASEDENGNPQTTPPAIQTDADIAINFSIGPDPNATAWWERPANLVVSGIYLGLVLALASIGLSLVFGTTGLTNFAHGELVTLGAAAAYIFNRTLDLHILIAAPLALLFCALFGLAQDRGLWHPLQKRRTGLVAMMIVSIGFSIFLRYLYQYIMGADSVNFAQFTEVAPWVSKPININPRDMAMAGICLIVLVTVSLIVQKTRVGKAMRAVSDNPALAASSGINVDRVITFVWVAGTTLAGLAGIVFALNAGNGFDYQTGFQLLLLIFAAVTLGGLGNIWGAMVGGLIVGLVVELSTLFISSDLKYATALVILIGILLVRPQGVLGRAERVG